MSNTIIWRNWPTARKPVVLPIVVLLAIVIVCVLVVTFGKAFPLEPDEAAGWDILLKTVAGAAALLTAILALPRYLAEREAGNRAALAEARKPFFTAQQAVYMELVDVAAKLSNPSSFTQAERDATSASFWVLYWGKVPLIADETVSKAVDNFENELCAENRSEIRMRNASMALARACAASLGFRKPA